QPGRKHLPGLPNIQRVRDRVDIAEDGSCPRITDGQGRGDKRVGRQKDLFSAANPQGTEAQEQRIRATRHSNAIGCAVDGSELFSKLRSFGTENEVAAREEGENGFVEFILEGAVLTRKINELNFHSVSPLFPASNNLAGTPATVAPSDTSWVTTAP